MAAASAFVPVEANAESAILKVLKSFGGEATLQQLKQRVVLRNSTGGKFVVQEAVLQLRHKGLVTIDQLKVRLVPAAAAPAVAATEAAPKQALHQTPRFQLFPKLPSLSFHVVVCGPRATQVWYALAGLPHIAPFLSNCNGVCAPGRHSLEPGTFTTLAREIAALQTEAQRQTHQDSEHVVEVQWRSPSAPNLRFSTRKYAHTAHREESVYLMCASVYNRANDAPNCMCVSDYTTEQDVVAFLQRHQAAYAREKGADVSTRTEVVSPEEGFWRTLFNTQKLRQVVADEDALVRAFGTMESVEEAKRWCASTLAAYARNASELIHLTDKIEEVWHRRMPPYFLDAANALVEQAQCQMRTASFYGCSDAEDAWCAYKDVLQSFTTRWCVWERARDRCRDVVVAEYLAREGPLTEEADVKRFLLAMAEDVYGVSMEASASASTSKKKTSNDSYAGAWSMGTPLSQWFGVTLEGGQLTELTMDSYVVGISAYSLRRVSPENVTVIPANIRRLRQLRRFEIRAMNALVILPVTMARDMPDLRTISVQHASTVRLESIDQWACKMPSLRCWNLHHLDYDQYVQLRACADREGDVDEMAGGYWVKRGS